MPIRFKHQASAGLIGAYASGQAASRSRGKKYALGMAMQQQRYEQRMAERMAAFGQRNRLAGGGGGAGQLAGKWIDPTAIPLERQQAGGLDPRQAVQQRAQKKANDRARRQGKDLPYPELQPYFQSAAELKRQQKLDDENRQRQQTLDDENREREWKQKDDALTDSREDRKGLAGALQPVPDEATGPDAQALRQVYADLKKMLGGGVTGDGGILDWNDPKQREDILNKVDEYNQGVADIPKPDPNQGALVRDEETGNLRAREPGEQAQYWDQGPGQAPKMTDEYAAEKAFEMKMREEKGLRALDKLDEPGEQREELAKDAYKIWSDVQKAKKAGPYVGKINTLDDAFKQAQQNQSDQRDLREMADAEQRKTAGTAPGGPPAAPKPASPTITTKADLDALPDGTEFIGPDGKRRRKT